MQIIHYCCGSYFKNSRGGVARFDYHLHLLFPKITNFIGPQEKNKMLDFLKTCSHPIVITDNHLSCDIPTQYPVVIVHHGCAKTTALRSPHWKEPWKSLCVNGQNKMLKYRNPSNTYIVSISTACSHDFTQYFGDVYTRFTRYDILNSCELDELLYKTSFRSSNPIILGNWNDHKKGAEYIQAIQNSMPTFRFKQLHVVLRDTIERFNQEKQQMYLDSDIFLQLSVSEGNSYATLDAVMNGLVVVATDVGLFFKDVPDDCFVRLDWQRRGDINYIKERIEYGWNNRETLSKNIRAWYMKHSRFCDWKKKIKQMIKDVYTQQYLTNMST
jgi:hypothetical protein